MTSQVGFTRSRRGVDRGLDIRNFDDAGARRCAARLRARRGSSTAPGGGMVRRPPMSSEVGFGIVGLSRSVLARIFSSTSARRPPVSYPGDRRRVTSCA
ncbi:MAG: hypothetical protein U0Q03_06915 [Acidimicrobiales bacterium]